MQPENMNSWTLSEETVLSNSLKRSPECVEQSALQREIISAQQEHIKDLQEASKREEKSNEKFFTIAQQSQYSQFLQNQFTSYQMV